MNQLQREGLGKITHDKSIRAFLEFYCATQSENFNRTCAQKMRPPAESEIASAYASKAEVFDRLVSDLDEMERRS